MAPGWWVLIILALICVAAIFYLVLRHWRASIWRREAIAEFRMIRDHYLQQPSSTQLIALNQLLKRTLCTVRGTREYMHHVEQDWARELNSVTLKNDPVLRELEIRVLSEELYTPQQEPLDQAALQRLELWIRKAS